ncbi:MAG: gluconate 2-dehydrogenase subunit 3 family protein [Acidobacteria bacterium]|nr:gluconate 2-dehydrogenase subunit 3 family protein [Acidobacteriota bacterium]
MMENVNRRRMLQVLGAAPAMATIAWSDAEAQQAHQHAQQARRAATAAKTAFKPKYFTAHEYATITTLANLIIPADDRSGNASDAGVPEFIDYMMIDQPERQLLMRGGIRWLDNECRKQFDQAFVKCTAAQQTQICDALAYPAKASPAHANGARFFSAVRDLTATGFFTSKIGIADLDYKGNTFVMTWTGAPKEALDHIGVSYDAVKAWYPEG